MGELFGCYLKYARKNSLEIEVVDNSDRSITAKIDGPNAERFFYRESGKHVVQRVSETERNGRTHTSVVSVAILPLPEQVEVSTIPKSELEITTCKSRGPGGQAVNKIASAVRVRHIPTGIVVRIEGRDQQVNKRVALKIVEKKVADLSNSQLNDKRNNDKRSQFKGGNRSDKTRTYNFKDGLVTDHITGKSFLLKKFMKGDFDFRS